MTTALPGTHSAEDLLRPEYRDLDCELWDGTIMVREPHGGYSSPLSARLVYLLLRDVDRRALGWVGDSGGGYWLRKGPDRVLVPDVSFVSRARLTAWPHEGFAEIVPDLVAEVRSPTDTWTAVLAKGGIWLAHGVQVVWLVDPPTRSVTTLRPLADPEISGPDGTFSGAPALSDLRIAVAELFRDLP